MVQQAIQVTWEDQQAINSFSKLNSRLHETEAKIVGHKKVIESLEEANDELMLSDEEVVRYSVGEVLVHVSKDEAEAKLATLTEKLQGELRGYLAEVDEIKGTMKELKVRLYGKFGNAINLEED